MRIALLSAEYPPQPGGVGDYTQRLATELHQRDLAVVVITSGVRTAGESGGPLRYNLAITRWNWRCWQAIDAALADLHPDVLHIQYQTGAYGMHPAINLLPWWLARHPSRPGIVVTAHDLLLPYLFPKAGPMRRWVTQRLLYDSDAVVVTNQDDYQQLHSLQAPKTLALIPIGSNIPVAAPDGYKRSQWRAELGVKGGQTLIAYFGLLSPSKGVDLLLTALAQLPARFRLLVIGGEALAPQDRSYAAEIQRRIDSLGLRERVTITGHCGEREVSGHLQAADLAALPFTDGASFRRGSLLATLAHGTPVVTTIPAEHTPAAAPHLAHGENAWLVPRGDPRALAAAVLQLSEDAALRKHLSMAGQALAAQFSWSAIAERHEVLYRQLFSAAAKPSTSAHPQRR